MPKSKTDPAADKALDDAKTADSSARLDTGMRVSEAMRRAARWWEGTGREEMRKHGQRQAEKGRAFATLDPDDPNFLPSGIMHGFKWDDLKRHEKLRVVKAWHHEMIRKPDMVLGDYELPHIVPWKCFYCGETALFDEDLPDGSSRPMCENHMASRYPKEWKEHLN